jgi:hypothetical protein
MIFTEYLLLILPEQKKMRVYLMKMVRVGKITTKKAGERISRAKIEVRSMENWILSWEIIYPFYLSWISCYQSQEFDI